MTTIIVLIARLVLEETKSTSTGEITKLGDKHFGPQNRLDLAGTFARNKLAPSMAIAFNYASTNDEYDESTGESYRKTPFGKKWEDDDSLNMLPIYWQSIREIQAEDPGASAEFLTALGAFGLGSAVYSSNVGTAKRSRSLTSSRGSSRRKSRND
jgi:hypothetical protein